MPDRSYYCPGNSAKQAQSRAMRRFYKAASKQLPDFQFETHFNPGGPAVWGETYAKLYKPNPHIGSTICQHAFDYVFQHCRELFPREVIRQTMETLDDARMEALADPMEDPLPVVEAFDTSLGILVRQWDGRNSGRNNYVKTLEQFVYIVRQLASGKFERF
jgi:hypothetical protein